MKFKIAVVQFRINQYQPEKTLKKWKVLLSKLPRKQT